MINAISSVNTTFNAHRRENQPITQKHIDVVTDSVNVDVIRTLDKLGLMNRPLLYKVRKQAKIQMADSTAASVRTVVDILKNPEYVLEKRDNGYYYLYESPYNYKESLEGYAKGPKTYTTPVLARANEFRIALNNIAQNGTVEDARAFDAFARECLTHNSAMKKHYKILNEFRKQGNLYDCHPVVGSYGIVEEMRPTEYLDKYIFSPLIDVLDACSKRG